MRLEADKDYGAPGLMIWVERAIRESEEAATEDEVGLIDARVVKYTDRYTQIDVEPDDIPGEVRVRKAPGRKASERELQ